MHVNIDSIINMMKRRKITDLARRRRGHNAARRQPRHALRLRQPRLRPFRAGARRQPRERRYCARRRRAAAPRAEERRNPEKAAEHALHWGRADPGVGDHAHRRRAALLPRPRRRASWRARESLEDVASLIWTGAFDAHVFAATPLHVSPARHARRDLPFVSRAQSAAAAGRRARSAGFRPPAARRRADRLAHREPADERGGGRRAELEDRSRIRCTRRWAPKRVARRSCMRAALILCADHELNVSAFTARCVASAGSTPYAVVIAGLAALEGTRHGGTTARVEAHVDELRRARDLARALADRLRRGEPIDGFGHPLYRERRPARRRCCSTAAERSEIGGARVRPRFAEAARKRARRKPTVDFALVAVARVARPADRRGADALRDRPHASAGSPTRSSNTGRTMIRPRANTSDRRRRIKGADRTAGRSNYAAVEIRDPERQRAVVDRRKLRCAAHQRHELIAAWKSRRG